MLVDFYSILGVSFPSSSEEIQSAYITKKDSLGKDSANSSNPNYQARVDVELAYRVLGASYILKTAYDEEYEKAKQVGFNDYEVAHESLLPDIERERDFVVNKLLNPNFKMPKTTTPHEKGWGMKALGCIGKGFLIYLCLVAFVQIKKYSKDSVKESYETPSTYATKESAESQLRSFVLEKNISLPQDMDENITTQEVVLERDAIVYVYKVNDNFFAEFKDHAFSRDIQLKNLRTVYDKMKPMIDLLIETHRGIYYRYICRESGETTEFKIYYSDLVDLQ
jgi:hypothetical protein